MSKTLLEYGREGSDFRLYLVIPQEELEKNPQLMVLQGITPEILQKIQELAGEEPQPKEELLAKKSLFETPEHPIVLTGIEKDTEAEPMNSRELDEALGYINEEGRAILDPYSYPKDRSVWDETPV